MKSINTLKIMTDNKKGKEKNRTNTSSESQKLEQVHKFIDSYVKPKIGILGLNNYDVDNYVIDLTLALNDINVEDLTEDNQMFTEEEVHFVTSNDSKVKARIGKRIASTTIKSWTYWDKLNEFIENYVNPKIKELNDNGTITYDLDAMDNKTKLATKRIASFISKFVDDSAKASLRFDLYFNLYGEEFINKWDFIFGEDKACKENFANIVYEFLKENHNTIDYKNLDSIDFADYTGSKINIYVKE